jgi:hypothetical protein
VWLEWKKKKVTPARGVEGEKNSQTKISECVRCTTGCTDGGHFAFFLRSAARAAVESSSQPSTLFEARGTVRNLQLVTSFPSIYRILSDVSHAH